ncbi:unnamed protein product [Auanema sp. JU1783]|nr:unnamed protein product [Auanema sp. JU1783]
MASNNDCVENILTFKILNNQIIHRFSLPYTSVETLFEKLNIELKERNISNENIRYIDDSDDLVCLKSISDLGEALRSKPSVLCVVVFCDNHKKHHHQHDFFGHGHDHHAAERAKCMFRKFRENAHDSSSESSSGEESDFPHHRKHHKFMKMMKCMQNEKHKHGFHRPPHFPPHFGRRSMLPGDGDDEHFSHMSHHFKHGFPHSHGRFGKFRGVHHHPFGHFGGWRRGCPRGPRFHGFGASEEMFHRHGQHGRRHPHPHPHF